MSDWLNIETLRGVCLAINIKETIVRLTNVEERQVGKNYNRAVGREWGIKEKGKEKECRNFCIAEICKWLRTWQNRRTNRWTRDFNRRGLYMPLLHLCSLGCLGWPGSHNFSWKSYSSRACEKFRYSRLCLNSSTVRKNTFFYSTSFLSRGTLA